MVKKTTFFDLVPNDYAVFSGEDLATLLTFAQAESDWEDRVKNLAYTKVSIQYLWYILSTLKKLHGKRVFNKVTRLRYWDVSLIMVDTKYLTDVELINALNIVKKQLTSYGILPENAPYARQIISSILYGLMGLHREMNYKIQTRTRTPGWEDISPEMDLYR